MIHITIMLILLFNGFELPEIEYCNLTYYCTRGMKIDAVKLLRKYNKYKEKTHPLYSLTHCKNTVELVMDGITEIMN